MYGLSWQSQESSGVASQIKREVHAPSEHSTVLDVRGPSLGWLSNLDSILFHEAVRQSTIPQLKSRDRAHECNLIPPLWKGAFGHDFCDTNFCRAQPGYVYIES
jgi:hypothetical protein